jgi:hypothetical protein
VCPNCGAAHTCPSLLLKSFRAGGDHAASCGGTGVARASYWSLRHCPIAESTTRLSQASLRRGSKPDPPLARGLRGEPDYLRCALSALLSPGSLVLVQTAQVVTETLVQLSPIIRRLTLEVS